MATSAVPVSWDGLGVEGHTHTKVFADSLHDEAGEDELVSSIDTLDWADLVLPLAGHDLAVDAADGDASVQAGAVVCLNNETSMCVLSADRAVVRALWGGVAVGGPAQRGASVHLEQRVLCVTMKKQGSVLGPNMDI